MAVETIREFLVSMGYSSDAAGASAFESKLTGAIVVANLVASAIEAAARAIADKFTESVNTLVELNRASERLNSRVPELRALGQTVEQLGGSAADARASLERFSRYLRETPGSREYLARLGVQTKLNGVILSDAQIFINTNEFLAKTLPPYVAGLYRESLGGLDEQTQLVLGRSKEQTDAIYAKRVAFNIAAGVTDKAGEDAVRFQIAAGQVKNELGDMAIGFEVRLFRTLSDPMEKFGAWIDAHGADLNKALGIVVDAVANVAKGWLENAEATNWPNAAAQLVIVAGEISSFIIRLGSFLFGGDQTPKEKAEMADHDERVYDRWRLMKKTAGDISGGALGELPGDIGKLFRSFARGHLSGPQSKAGGGGGLFIDPAQAGELLPGAQPSTPEPPRDPKGFRAWLRGGDSEDAPPVLSVYGRAVSAANPLPIALADSGGGGSGGGWLGWLKGKLGLGGGGGAGGGGGGGDASGSTLGPSDNTPVPAPMSAGTYRPVYKLGQEDLSDDVVSVIAGEASASGQSVDAVINNMVNRLGSNYGPSGNLRQVALSPGQYVGRGHPDAARALFIRQRIAAIAAGSVPDETHGSNEFRTASYGAWATPESRNGIVIGGNRFARNPRARVSPYAPYQTPRFQAPPPEVPMSLTAEPHDAIAGQNAALEAASGIDTSAMTGATNKMNTFHIIAPDPHTAVGLVMQHFKSAH